MARPFHYSVDRRIVNSIIKFLLRYDLAPEIYYLLTVAGRKTGEPHSIPIVVIEDADQKWLVAPYGIVDWVKNVRAAGRVRLSRGSKSQEFSVHELTAEDGAPVLAEYLRQYPLTKYYFNAKQKSSLNEFIQDARSRPVFELISLDR